MQPELRITLVQTLEWGSESIRVYYLIHVAAREHGGGQVKWNESETSTLYQVLVTDDIKEVRGQSDPLRCEKGQVLRDRAGRKKYRKREGKKEYESFHFLFHLRVILNNNSKDNN